MPLTHWVPAHSLTTLLSLHRLQVCEVHDNYYNNYNYYSDLHVLYYVYILHEIHYGHIEVIQCMHADTVKQLNSVYNESISASVILVAVHVDLLAYIVSAVNFYFPTVITTPGHIQLDTRGPTTAGISWTVRLMCVLTTLSCSWKLLIRTCHLFTACTHLGLNVNRLTYE